MSAVVVLNHSIISTHIAHVHREGCKDIERDARSHGSSVYGPFETVADALADYLDEGDDRAGLQLAGRTRIPLLQVSRGQGSPTTEGRIR